MRLAILLLPVLAAACSAPLQPRAAIAANGRSIQSAPPSINSGVTSVPLSTIELAPEVGLTGYQLRARAITIVPGGYTAAHEHKGRPTQEYVAKGVVIEVRNGVPVEHRAGEMAQGVNGVHHWWENHGTETVVLVPIDVTKLD